MNGKKLQNSPNEIIGWKDNMIVLYRLSDNGYKKPKFENATKIHCLENALLQLAMPCATFYLFIDDNNLTDETKQHIEKSKLKSYITETIHHTAGSSAASFRLVFNFALDKFNNNDIIYFLEDDYLHLPTSYIAIKEGIERADYVSLYDHNDTYIPASMGGNVFVTDGGYSTFPTYVIRTNNFHWRTVGSTTMTFATTKKTLNEDKYIWLKNTEGTYPQDFKAFSELTNNIGRSLITPIPGLSTHCEPKWASPGTDWIKV